MRYQPLLVDIINYHIRIAFVACCKDDQLEVSSEFLQTLSSIWSNVYPSLHHRSVGETNRQQYITGHVRILVAVDQGLVQVKDQGRFAGGRQRPSIGSLRHGFVRVFNELEYLY